jgi:membrane-bound lytic murein transglycosylase A
MAERPRRNRSAVARRGARRFQFCALLTLFVFAGSAVVAGTDGAKLQRMAFPALPGWRDDPVSQALPALRSSCRILAGKPADSPIGPGAMAGTAGDWRTPCKRLTAVGSSAAAVRRVIETSFVPFAVVDADGPDGLITGYYEPELRGSRERSARYSVPLYRPPPDPASGSLPRAAIDGGALAGKGLELLWLADPIEAFFLQAQGSGRVRLAEGGSLRVGYAASNGLTPTMVGRILVERGELTKETASMQTVRQWLRDHPAEAPALMRMNARYIFFREIPGDGPLGALGVALTPGRSLAIDPDLLPLGAPLWLDTTYPAGTPEAGQPLQRLVVAQDSGGAIKGAVRGDLYWGSGEAALRYAGPMKQPGHYYLLLPKAVAERM